MPVKLRVDKRRDVVITQRAVGAFPRDAVAAPVLHLPAATAQSVVESL